jgi:hypothetical protein
LIATLKKSIIKKDDVQSEANKKKEVVCSAIKLVLALKDHDVSGNYPNIGAIFLFLILYLIIRKTQKVGGAPLGNPPERSL